MKTILVIICSLLAVFQVHSQIITFPDVNFKNKIIADGVDTNMDGEIQISEAEAITELDVGAASNDPNKISNMDGIEHFVNLIELRCQQGEFTTLDVTALTQLELLYSYYGTLTSIDLTGLTSLRSLWVNQNNLTTIDTSTLSSLYWLYAHGNQFSQFDLSGNPNIEALWAGENVITSVDFSDNPLMGDVQLHDNLLTVIDINFLSNLEVLGLGNNSIAAIDVSNMPLLYSLDLSGNPIIDIDCSLTGVRVLYAGECPNLESINVQNNVSDLPDPDLLYFPLYLWNTPALNSICMDAGDWPALQESGYDPSGVIVYTGANCTLGLDEFESANTYVYPNPVTDHFNIEVSEPVSLYTLYALSGKQQVQTSNLHILKSQAILLPSGMYFLRLDLDNGNSEALKFIKN